MILANGRIRQVVPGFPIPIIDESSVSMGSFVKIVSLNLVIFITVLRLDFYSLD